MEKRTEVKLRGTHCLNVYVSFELKERLQNLADRYDRTLADLVRGIFKIGIPMMEGISESEEMMVKEYIRFFLKLRKADDLKEL